MREVYASRGRHGAAAEASWAVAMDAYAVAHPTEAADLRRRLDGGVPADLLARLPTYPVPVMHCTALDHIVCVCACV